MGHLPGLGGLLDGLMRKRLEEVEATNVKLRRMQQPLEDALRSLAAGGREDLLTAEQFGRRIGKHAKTVYKMAREGKLPFVQDGRHRRFRVSDAREWVAQHLED
jgi:excisionase family DNA binding protein